MCSILCLFSALSRRVDALQISIIIITIMFCKYIKVLRKIIPEIPVFTCAENLANSVTFGRKPN